MLEKISDMEKADWDEVGYDVQTVSIPEDGIRFGLDIGHKTRDIHQRFSELHFCHDGN